MSYGTYLKSSLIGAFIVLVAIGLIGFVLTVAGAGWTVTLLVCGMVLLAALAVNVLSWLQRRTFFGDLELAASRVEHPLWIAEMVDRPDFAEGEVVYDALRAISKAANDDVASCQRQVADYREYTAQKRFMDDVAAVYIEQQGASGCLDSFTENDYDYVFSYSGSELVIREPGLGGRVLLRVVLESTDTDGNGTLVVSYIYGLA